MRVPYIKIHQSKAKEEIDKLKRADELLGQFKIRRDGTWVLIPVKSSSMEGEFEEIIRKRMEHVGSFEKIADFFVIRERSGWEGILQEIRDKQNPRAVFLDRGVEGQLRIRSLELIFGSGKPSGIHKENGLRYMVDLEKAYFSPRLGGLRGEITKRCIESTSSKIIVDMYAGVGPISVPLLKAGKRVISIDMNPFAVKLLSENMKLNKVHGEVLIADSNKIYGCFGGIDQIVMNNPTQPLSVTKSIIDNLESGTIIHTTYISGNIDKLEFDGAEVLERKIVHGYSPSSSLFYLRMKKK
ncbi:MAG: methyltransferase [Thermoplasmatales archaeon]